MPENNTIVSLRYVPPFCNLSLSTKHRGGLYVGCDIFSHDYALPSGATKHDLIVGAKCQAERCSRH